jgi:hypothetical protein
LELPEKTVHPPPGTFDFDENTGRVVADVTVQTEPPGRAVDEGPESHPLDGPLEM